MTNEELKTILDLHKKWLNDESDGVCANLHGANLSCANLCGANLCDANLCDANLRDADLRGANLRGANLRGANLRSADLRDANLRDAIITNIKINECTTFIVLSCPEEGAFIAWKKCANNTLVKLLIPASAKRSSATSYKCRASKAKVLAIYDDKGKKIEKTTSNYDNGFIYEVGKTISVDDFDDNRWVECGKGIHFFMSKDMAKQYN